MPTASPWLPSFDELEFTLEVEITSTAKYAAPTGSKVPTTTRADNEFLVARTAYLSNLRVHVTDFPTTSAGTVTLFKNGSATALTVSIPTSPVVGGWVANTSNMVQVSPGDKITLKLEAAGSDDWDITAIQMMRTSV